MCFSDGGVIAKTNIVSSMSETPNILALPEPESDYPILWDVKPKSGEAAYDETLDWPKLSIVTPSFNQGRFIERTIRCILLQGYPNLEYIIIDGGSTDQTLRIIEKYEPWISYWISEPDTGMYDAINKGFARSSGEIMGWSPTGDLYEPEALQIVGQVFQQKRQIEWLTSLYKVKQGEDGQETARYRVEGFNRRAFQKGLNMSDGNPFARYTIQQQSTFWRRSLWERGGGRMDDSMKGSGDFELWARFYQHAELFALDHPVGIFLTHDGQESVSQADRMQEEQARAFQRYGGKHMGRLGGWLRKRVLRRRPLSLLRYIQPIGFRCSSVAWINGERRASIVRHHFL